MMSRLALARAGLACALAIASPGFAAEEIDLERTTPVPASEEIPIADFFRPPLFATPKLNPTGTRFAALVETGADRTGLLVCDLETREARQLRGVANKDIFSVAWLDHERLLMAVSADKLYAEGLFVTHASNLQRNYPVESYSATSLVSVPRKTPLRPLIWIRSSAYENGADIGVVQLDASKDINRDNLAIPGSFQDANRDRSSDFGARASIIRDFPKPPGGVTVDYLGDKDGDLAFAITANAGVFSLHRLVGRKWIKSPVDLDEIYPVSHGDKPGELIVIGPRQAGKPRALLRLDAETGEFGELLCQDKAYDVDECSVYRHPVSRNVLGVRYSRGRIQTVWFDETYRQIQKLLDDSFRGKVAQVLGSSDDETKFFIAVYSDRQPVTYFAFDVGAKTIAQVKSTAPWIEPERMQPMNVLRCKTRDGYSLEAFVTLPAGASKKNPAPLVVLPHGGPWTRDVWGFDPEAQFLASLGYAVLQPNYRGSPGYTWMFPAADQWAFRKMHDDVTDAVNALRSTGMIDPQRIAIMGTSFGGYLAACGAVFEPELYRCAIAIAGVFDWAQVIRDAKYDQYTSAEFGILRRNLGDPAKKQEEFAAISPLRHIAQAKVPFFVAHGKDDSVASVTESRALIAQLERHDIPHEVMFVRGEGHGMSNLENQVRLYGSIERFLAQHLGPKASAAPKPSE